MKIYSSATKGVGVWSLSKKVAEMFARGGRGVHTATLAGVVFIVPLDARRVLPRNVRLSLQHAAAASGGASILRKEPFFKGFDAIIDPINRRNEQLVYVLDADALQRVKRV